ncbi:hypothetical protein IMG5_119320 [Ichthyophthirius multifiliis]|uniref:Uncharacterized protein n=1 Tax=Ichthyophthirius multifiliis TaxID=5932 RepID=G0QUU0_ICHMU|nr:hypothetical protein IMG5_119320 [Ichthyophthirius multifiliis]EGR31020.1 hypothetical protein IMG5_119320 [Ichthyophthirius multifiliis]|eukprot:XP_004034506.1 hypothetical protein IMG5_119320 [Ichthyophthirius multifiliis]
MLNDIVNQSLEIAEYILKDDKHRKSIENSHVALNHFLNVADKLDNSQSKIILVKFIIMIAENVDSKVNFVQNEGFNKLMVLLMDKDEKVSRIISRALLHFLQIDNSDESMILEQMKGQLEKQEDYQSIKAKIKKQLRIFENLL